MKQFKKKIIKHLLFEILKINYITILILFFVKTSYGLESNLQYDVTIPDQIQLNIQGKSLKKYATNLTKINLDQSGFIHDSHKDIFKILVSFKKQDQTMRLKGKARITGNYNDHIKIREGISSLIIRLNKSNLGGITKFRLLLPVTRNGYNEIFWSVLMEYLGFPVPYRKMVNVYFNNDTRLIRMIFSERAEKEYLERYGFREAPIIEVDERQEYANRYWRNNPKKCLGEYLPTKNTCKLNDSPTYLPYKIENQKFLKNITSIEVFYRGIISLLDSEEDELNKYFKNLNNKYAKHGIGRINEKYIYNPIYHSKVPIYVDGMVNIPSCKKYIKSSKLTVSNQKDLKIVEHLFQSRSLGKPLTEDMKCIAIEIFKLKRKTNIEIKKISADLNYDLVKNLPISSFKPIIKRHDISSPVVHVSNNFKKAVYCNSINDAYKDICRPLKFSKLVSGLAGNLQPKKIDGYELFPITSISKPHTRNEVIEEISLNNSDADIYVGNNQIKFLKVKSSNSNINVHLSSEQSQIVFYNSLMKNSKIRILRPQKISYNNNKIRYNYRLLTGCFTLISSIIEDTHFYSERNNCEDAINFIKVKGKNISSHIINSSYDALDVDFSKITFSDIFIENAGNDCLDFSSSTFNIQNFNGTNCHDKAISLGEQSVGVVRKLNLKNSKIGFAVKDSSELNLLSSIKKKNVNTCGMLYKKKQEFDGGQLKSINLEDCIVLLDDFSLHNKNENLTCRFVSSNQFFRICLTQFELILNKREVFPKNAVINLISLNKSKINNVNLRTMKNCMPNFNLCRIDFNENKFNFKNGLKISVTDPKNDKIIFITDYIKPLGSF